MKNSIHQKCSTRILYHTHTKTEDSIFPWPYVSGTWGHMVFPGLLWYLAELDDWKRREKRETKEGINERGCINEKESIRDFSFVVSVNNETLEKSNNI